MNISDQKKALRNELLSKREAMTEGEWSRKSTQIIEQLRELELFRHSKVIHAYISMNERREVNTHPLLKELLGSGKKVLVPVTDFETTELRHIQLDSFEDLKPNKWGVLEPEAGKEADEEPDLVLVPLLAADLNFNRLGYGKGFYDRFLSESSASKAGLLFDDFILDEIPVEAFDEKLDILITEKRVYARNN